MYKIVKAHSVDKIKLFKLINKCKYSSPELYHQCRNKVKSRVRGLLSSNDSFFVANNNEDIVCFFEVNRGTNVVPPELEYVYIDKKYRNRIILPLVLFFVNNILFVNKRTIYTGTLISGFKKMTDMIPVTRIYVLKNSTISRINKLFKVVDNGFLFKQKNIHISVCC